MTDRELLELAAKAAGFKIIPYSYDEVFGFCVTNHSGWWNPLKDDGDALRLANKLELSIKHIAGAVIVKQHETILTMEQHSISDVDAATRRAIVRAAAEIGRIM